MDENLQTRHVSPLSGAFNFRDLGGLATRDGRVTQCGRLYRSDTLQALTPDDVVRLTVEFGLEAIVDLRLASEVAGEGRGPVTIPRQSRGHSGCEPLEAAGRGR